MTDIRNISLIGILTAAVLWDLYAQRIPNGIIVTGLAWGFFWQIFRHGIMGVLLYGGGCLMPVLLFGVLYYFRMIGAGDVKALCVAGGFLGPYDCMTVIITAIFLGGVIAVWILCRRHLIGQRLYYLADYLSHYSREKEWSSYLNGVGEEARFRFSVPVLLAVFCYIGGIF